MTSRKKDVDEAPVTDFGLSQVAAKFAGPGEVGHQGPRTDPFDDDAYTLQSGPHSPTAVETAKAMQAKELNGP